MLLQVEQAQGKEGGVFGQGAGDLDFRFSLGGEVGRLDGAFGNHRAFGGQLPAEGDKFPGSAARL